MATYFNGDEIEDTGETITLPDGRAWFIYRFIEGHRKGETGVTLRPFEPIARAEYDAKALVECRARNATFKGKVPQVKW